jgi:hypothetical protein
MLVFQLSKTWQIHVKKPAYKLNQLPLPLLFDPSLPINKGQVYIAKADQLSSPPNDNCIIICCEGEPENIYEHSSCGLIVIDACINLLQIINKVQSIYTLYQDWDQQLSNMVTANQSLQELLNISSLVLENLLCLTDENINYLAASSKGIRVSENDLPVNIFNDKVTIQNLTQSNKKVSDHQYIFKLNDDQHFYDSCTLFFNRIFYEKIDLGALCIFPTEHKLQEHDRQLLDILSSYVEVLLFRYSQFENDSLEIILSSLISSKKIKNEDNSVLESALNLEPADYCTCVVIQLAPNVLTVSGKYLQHRIKIELAESVSLIQKNQLILLINESKTKMNKENLLLLLKFCLGGSEYFAGISEPFSNFSEFRDHYLIARSIVRFSGADTARVVTIADCWDRLILSNCTSGLPVHLIFSSGFRQLIAYNKTSSVDYLNTLRVYLEEGKNANRAAARLIICRNTFLYRLEKLTSILNDDLNNPDICFRLEFCLRLNDMLQDEKV